MTRHRGNGNVRWGVIGLGWFGEIHADTLAQMPGIELAALCTRRPERLHELADRYDVAGRYTDYKELLADPSIDAVGITTHIHDHRDIAVAALRAGKHVFLEKPMAPTVEDCNQIIQAVLESDGLFMVGHICRFDPRVALAKQAIDEGRLGKIISMHARRNLSKAIGEANLDKISALMGDGIHDADLMLWFTGAAPVSVYAQEVHPGSCKYPDGAWAMIRFDNGAVGVVESIWHLPEQHALCHRRSHGGHRHRGSLVRQLRPGGSGDPRCGRTEHARHDVLAQRVRRTFRRASSVSCGTSPTASSRVRPRIASHPINPEMSWG